MCLAKKPGMSFNLNLQIKIIPWNIDENCVCRHRLVHLNGTCPFIALHWCDLATRIISLWAKNENRKRASSKCAFQQENHCCCLCCKYYCLSLRWRLLLQLSLVVVPSATSSCFFFPFPFLFVLFYILQLFKLTGACGEAWAGLET